MNIGKTTYPHALFLAPMAGVTDRAFRHICRKYGAQGLTTEMISSRALIFGDKKTQELARIDDDEKPCAIQIFGNEPDVMARAAVIVARDYDTCAIDVNMGCPAPKIAGNGDGSAIMKNPRLAYEIIARMRDSLDNAGFDTLPVTVKMRSGFTRESINAVEVALECERAGACAVTVHGRTREQMYSPPVDLDIIREVKKSVSVPVIGNGDIYTVEDAMRMKSYTGCDGLMIGRGALGNPYIFAQITACLDGEKMPQITSSQWLGDITEHMELIIKDKGEEKGVREMHKHIAWYISGIPGAADMRRRANLAKTYDEILTIAKEASELFEQRSLGANQFKISNLT